MLTSPYSLKYDYTVDVPVSAGDLNRRAQVLASQLPGALRGMALCAGVFPLWNPPDDISTPATLVADLASKSSTALRVSISGALFVVGAGAAYVEPGAQSGSAPLIFTQTQGLSVPLQSASDGTTLYLHLALSLPTGDPRPGALDSQTGSAPTLLLSELEQEPGALLLASYTSEEGLVDRRTFTAPVLLAQEIVALVQRLDALDKPATDTGNSTDDALTPAKFLALQTRVTNLEGALDDIKAQIARLNAGANPFPAPFDILADEIALTRASLAELNPPSIERGQISVVGPGFGHAQNDTPDYTPDTGDPLELPFDPIQGLFAP